MREKILDELERLTALRGRYTLVNDFCSAAILTRQIRALYRKLETAPSMQEYVRSLTDTQLRPVNEIERDRALRYKGTERAAGAERDYLIVRAEMRRRNLLAILKLGDPPFPVAVIAERCIAKLEHVWHAVRRYAKRHGYQYQSSYGVIGVAPT